jgi:hypothetical protein
MIRTLQTVSDLFEFCFLDFELLFEIGDLLSVDFEFAFEIVDRGFSF